MRKTSTLNDCHDTVFRGELLCAFPANSRPEHATGNAISRNSGKGARPDSMPPVTSSPLNRSWLRLRGRDKWLPATATLEDRNWVARRESGDGAQAREGHWHVAYSYSVDGRRFAGNFVDFASADDDYLRPGAPFEIRYNPRRPSQSYYPAVRSELPFRLLLVVMGIVLAVLLLLVSLGGVRLAQ
jgi:hypothetical protein